MNQLAHALAKFAAKDNSEIAKLAAISLEEQKRKQMEEEHQQATERRAARAAREAAEQEKKLLRKVEYYEDAVLKTRGQGLFNLNYCSDLTWRSGRAVLAYGRPCIIKWALIDGALRFFVVKYELPQEIFGIPGRHTPWAIVPEHALSQDPRHEHRQQRPRKLVRIVKAQ